MKVKNNFFGIERKENETEFEFCLRVCVMKSNKEIEEDWQDIVDYFQLGVHRDTLRKNFVGEFGVDKVVKYYQDKLESKVVGSLNSDDEDDLLLGLEMKKLEIQREKIKLQSVKREINHLNRLEARIEIITESFMESLKHLPQLNIKFATDDKGENEASILLSDLHIGKGINTPHNKFNLDIAKQRLEKLATQVVEYCDLHKVGTLNIDILGDLIENNLHLDSQVEQVCDAMDQIAYAGEYVSLFIDLIAPYFNNIKLHSVSGNHDRLEKNLKMSRSVETFIKLIDRDIEKRTGLKFERSNVDDEIEVYTLNNGRKVALQHGHNLKGGIENNVMVLANHLKMHIDYSHIGHFHNFKFSNGTVVNGALCGSDKFANKLRFNNKASQVLAVYYEDGSQILHNIILN